MKKFTIIYHDPWEITNPEIKMERLTAPDIQSVMKSPYGEKAQFIFQGWPLMEGETSENGYGLPIVGLD